MMSDEQPSTSMNGPQVITPGLAVEWLFQQQIVVYRVTSISIKLLEIWTETTVQIIDRWPKDKPYRALHDLSAKGVGISYSVQVQYELLNLGITKQGRQQVEHILGQRLDFTAQIALLFNSSFSGNVGQVFANLNKNYLPTIQYKAFFDQEAALEWLSAGIEH
jgi:hypothetical protein